MKQGDTFPLKIAAYTSDLWEHVCPTIRILQPLTAAGMEIFRGNDWHDGQVRIYPNLVDQADLVLLQRDFPKHVEAYENVTTYAHRLGKPVVYEIDDILIELDSNHPDLVHYLESRPSVLRAILESDAVTTSSHQLADYIREFNQNVFVLQNYLVDSFWQTGESSPAAEPAGPVRIGYMGGHSHRPDFDMVEPVIAKILDRYGKQVELQFWGIRPGEDILARNNVFWTHPYLVSYDEFARYFLQQKCSIFIAPLQNNLFNRCKSGLKYLEYSLLGVPGVYSAIPPYRDMITPGLDGFLADQPGDWEAQLSALIESPELRKTVGAAAQKNVQSNWMLSQNAYRWQDAYQQIIRTYPQNRNTTVENTHRAFVKTQRWYIDLAKNDAIYHSEMTRRMNLLEEQVGGSKKRLAAATSELETALILRRTQGIKLERQAENIIEMERQIASLQKQAAEKSLEMVQITAQVSDVQTSFAWRVSQMMYRGRLRLAPPGSLRERLYRKVIATLRFWRHHGTKATAKLFLSKIRRRPLELPIAPSSGPASRGVNYSIAEGSLLKGTAFTILNLLSDGEEQVDTRLVIEWLDRQTLTNWEYVIWDRTTGKTWRYGHEDEGMDAKSIEELIWCLNGKYVSLASLDLLNQNETYLESNLIALESEGLVFTVNINGSPSWANYYFEKGVFPGSLEKPLQRTCVQKIYLKEGFTIDAAARLMPKENTCAAVGKIIYHTTKDLDYEGAVAFDQILQNVKVTITNNLIWVQPPNSPEFTTFTQPLVPIDHVLPVDELPCSKPTVLVFMPFLAVGGAERVALDMIDYLKSDIRFIVFTLDEHDPAIGTTVNAFRKLTPYVYTARDFLNYHLNFSFVNHLIARYKPLTFYLANGSPWIYDALSAIRDQHPKLRFANQVYDHQVGWITRYDPVISSIFHSNIALNAKITEAYLEKGVKKEAIDFIENGTNPDEFDPAQYPSERCIEIKKKLHLPMEARIVTFMARLHAQKRPMDFVEAARRCADDSQLHFLLIGNGPLGKAIDAEIDRIGLRNITRLDFYRPSSDIYAISDVYVLPSEYEGMPMVVLEAQSMGKPVVVTPVGNNCEVLEVTKGGILTKKIGDPSELRQCIYRMLTEPPDSLATRQKIIDHYSSKVMGEKYRKALLGK